MNDYNRIKIVAPLFKEYVSRYFGNDVIAIYFYGSAVCGDFKKQSDYDFIVLLKAIDENTLCKVKKIHSEICENNSECTKLEGGYHMLEPENIMEMLDGVWVENKECISMCKLSIEPDSIYCINKYGLVVYGDSPKNLLPQISNEQLLKFSIEYLESFETKLKERCSSQKRLWGAILNACRSIYFIFNLFSFIISNNCFIAFTRSSKL